jgi:hypothetical protein
LRLTILRLPCLTTRSIGTLDTRVARLEERLTALADEMAYGSTFLPRLFLIETFLPRLFLIESEYQHRVVAAELAYVRSLVDDLRAERLTRPAALSTR